MQQRMEALRKAKITWGLAKVQGKKRQEKARARMALLGARHERLVDAIASGSMVFLSSLPRP